MRIGLMGGSFNPVHRGHLLLAEGAKRALNLDLTFWIPVNRPPHKDLEPGITTNEDRARMVQMAIRGNPAYKLSRIEMDRLPPSYSVDTVKQLRKENPGKHDWFFLVGSENGRELAKWKGIEELRKLVKFVVAARPGDPAAEVLPPWVLKLPMITMNVSSSEVRRRIRQGLDIRPLVPEPVARYIEEKGLYR